MDLSSLFGQLFFHLAILIVLAFVTVYAYFKILYTYWARKGVPYLKPKFPLGKIVIIVLTFTNHGVKKNHQSS